MNEEKQELSQAGLQSEAGTAAATAPRPRRRRRRRRRRKSNFYKIYFIGLAIALALIVIAYICTRGLMGEYEAAQPKYLAEEVFEEYFQQPLDYEKLLSDAQYSAGIAGDQAVRAYLEDQIGKETLTWSMAASNDPNEAWYMVLAGKKHIATICLTADHRTSHGFSAYSLSRLELALDPTAIPGAAITVKAPADYTVTVDGAALTQERLIKTYISEDVLKYRPEGMEGLTYADYTLSDLGALPQEVVVTAPTGERAEVSFDEVTNTYTASPLYSQALAEQYSDFVTAAVEGYAAYMQVVPGSGFGRIQKYFDAGSNLYRAISAAAGDLWMVKAPAGNEFKDVYIGEFYPWSDSVFSCHISFTQMLRRGDEWHPDVVDMYVFLHKTANGYQIYDWYHNE